MLSNNQFKKIYDFLIVDENGVSYRKVKWQIIVWIPFDKIQEFIEVMQFPYDFLEMVALKHDCIAIDIFPLLDSLGINAGDIFEDK